MVLKNEIEMKKALSIIEKFGSLSGIELNTSKFPDLDWVAVNHGCW